MRAVCAQRAAFSVWYEMHAEKGGGISLVGKREKGGGKKKKKKKALLLL